MYHAASSTTSIVTFLKYMAGLGQSKLYPGKALRSGNTVLPEEGCLLRSGLKGECKKLSL